MEGHCQSEKIYGYKQFENPDEWKAGVESLFEKTVFSSIRKGISATVYTQLSDVEEEVNGLVTYDREVVKAEPEWMKSLNERLCREMGE